MGSIRKGFPPSNRQTSTIVGAEVFDDLGEIEKLIRAGVIDLEMGLSYATNAGNLRLQLSDFDESAVAPAGPEVLRTPQIEELTDIER